eukprot:scaffold7602_cov123-Isochrysis_galbana.AAC.5
MVGLRLTLAEDVGGICARMSSASALTTGAGATLRVAKGYRPRLRMTEREELSSPAHGTPFHQSTTEPRTRRAGKLSDAGQDFTGPAIPRACPTGVSAPEVPPW